MALGCKVSILHENYLSYNVMRQKKFTTSGYFSLKCCVVPWRPYFHRLLMLCLNAEKKTQREHTALLTTVSEFKVFLMSPSVPYLTKQIKSILNLLLTKRDFTPIQINQSNLIRSQTIWISVASKSAWDTLLEIVYFLLILDCLKDLVQREVSLVEFHPC